MGLEFGLGWVSEVKWGLGDREGMRVWSKWNG